MVPSIILCTPQNNKTRTMLASSSSSFNINPASTGQRRFAYFCHYKTCPIKSNAILEFDINIPMSKLIAQVGAKLLLTINDPSAWCIVSHGNFKVKRAKDLYDGGQYTLVSEPLYRLCLAPRDLNENKENAVAAGNNKQR
uniref:Uncharacterized protein n=1 Tax=Entomoneis paludosa TaxID=265537 RepID=A0A7S2YH07_9STRA